MAFSPIADRRAATLCKGCFADCRPLVRRSPSCAAPRTAIGERRTANGERALSSPLMSDHTFVERIAETIQTNANARQIFGDPVERNGVTIIPIARVSWSFGGGGI